MGNDLDVLAEDFVKRVASGRAGLMVQEVPPLLVGQANIPLSTLGMSHQECRVPFRWRDVGGSRRGRYILRRRGCDRAEGTCEHESGHEQVPNSRSLLCLLTKVVSSFALFSISLVLSQALQTLRLLTTTLFFIDPPRRPAGGADVVRASLWFALEIDAMDGQFLPRWNGGPLVTVTQ